MKRVLIVVNNSLELVYLSITEASRLIKAGKLSPVELTQAYLDRIDAVDGTLKAYVTLLADEALDKAKTAESEISKGTYRGPLHGIPLAHKDLYDTKGVRTTAQSRVYENRIPGSDAAVITRLNEAGSILLGKLAMHEFAAGAPEVGLFEPARNPWNLLHVPGGSSSGSASAVAAGLAAGALGSDTGGSIRGPASFCGIVGLKPTYGLVSRVGVVPLSWSLDHVGPMTRTVEDNALMLQVLAGNDPLDPVSAKVDVPNYSEFISEDIKGLRIGVPRHYFLNSEFSNSSPEISSAVKKALIQFEQLGAHIVEVRMESLAFAGFANQLISLSESSAFHKQYLLGQPQNYGEAFRIRLYLAALITSDDYLQAQRARAVVREDFLETLNKVDLLVTPTWRTTAPAFADFNPFANYESPSFVTPFNLAGVPAMSIPCGFSSSGLPIGLQIAGKPFDEQTIFRAAYSYQQMTGWHKHRPPI
jgi:aspartyl-tRNA(Asn)/glutamyl-tRNA(Gln) amidotransferase subunit A